MTTPTDFVSLRMFEDLPIDSIFKVSDKCSATFFPTTLSENLPLKKLTDSSSELLNETNKVGWRLLIYWILFLRFNSSLISDANIEIIPWFMQLFFIWS